MPFWILLLSTLVLFQCKLSRPWETSYSGMVPQKIDPEGEEPSEDWGDVDMDNYGLPKFPLFLTLDYINPDPEAKGVLPSCHGPLDKDLAIGQLVCENNQTQKQLLYIKNIDQVCYTNPAFKTVRASTPLNFPDCKKVRILGFRFDPRLRVDVEL